MDLREQIGSQWDKKAKPDFFNPSRILFDRFYTSTQQNFYRQLFEKLPERMNTALEVGCGDAQNLVFLLVNQKIQTANGIDISQGALKGAELFVQHFDLKEKIQLKSISIAELKAATSFDLILGIQIINYVPDPNEFFEAVLPFISLDGYLLISDVEKLSLSPIGWVKSCAFIRKLFGKAPAQNHWVYHNRSQILKCAENRGLDLVSMTSSVHLISSLLHPLVYWLQNRNFPAPLMMCLARALYKLVASIRILEDCILKDRFSGRQYAMIWRKKKA